MHGLAATRGANQATGKPLAHKSKKKIHALLSAALASAVEKCIIPINVAYKALEREDSDNRSQSTSRRQTCI